MRADEPSLSHPFPPSPTPSLISILASVNVKQNVYFNNQCKIFTICFLFVCFLFLSSFHRRASTGSYSTVARVCEGTVVSHSNADVMTPVAFACRRRLRRLLRNHSRNLHEYAHPRTHTHARAKISVSSLLQFPFMFALLSMKLMFVTSFM